MLWLVSADWHFKSINEASAHSGLHKSRRRLGCLNGSFRVSTAPVCRCGCLATDCQCTYQKHSTRCCVSQVQLMSGVTDTRPRMIGVNSSRRTHTAHSHAVPQPALSRMERRRLKRIPATGACIGAGGRISRGSTARRWPTGRGGAMVNRAARKQLCPRCRRVEWFSNCDACTWVGTRTLPHRPSSSAEQSARPTCNGMRPSEHRPCDVRKQ